MTSYTEMIIQGLFIGIGTALGNWLSNKRLIPRIEKTEKHIKQKVKKHLTGDE